MESKLIIYVVFACVVQNSFVLSLNKTTGEILANLAKIQSDQDAEHSHTKMGVTAIFDKIQRLTAEHVYHLEPDTRNDTSISNETIQELRYGLNASYDALNIVVEEFDSVVQNFQNISSAYLDMGIAASNAALKLARSGSYSEYPAHVEDLKHAITLGLTVVTQTMLVFLRTGSKLTPECEAVIETLRIKSEATANQTSAAIMNAMKLYDDAVSGGNRDNGADLLSQIENHKSRALAALGDGGRYTFTGILTIYTKQNLRSGGPASKLHERRYAMARAIAKYQEACEVLYDLISDKLHNSYIGLEDAGGNDFSSTDVAQATFVTKLQMFVDIFLDTVRLFASPSNNREINATRQEMLITARNFSVIIFDAIDLAAHQNMHRPDTLYEIDALEKQLPYDKAVAQVFDVIRVSNPNIKDSVSSRMTDIEARALVQLKNMYSNIFDAIRDNGTASNLKRQSLDSANAFVRTVFAALEISFMQA